MLVLQLKRVNTNILVALLPIHIYRSFPLIAQNLRRNIQSYFTRSCGIQFSTKFNAVKSMSYFGLRIFDSWSVHLLGTRGMLLELVFRLLVTFLHEARYIIKKSLHVFSQQCTHSYFHIVSF